MKGKVLVISLLVLAIALSGCLGAPPPTNLELPMAEECVDLVFPNFEIAILEPAYYGDYEITFNSTDFGNGWIASQKTINCSNRFDPSMGETGGYLYCRCNKISQTEYSDSLLKVSKQPPIEEQRISLVIDPDTKSVVEYGCCVPLE